MQRIAYPQPVSYDLVLGPGYGCVQVTSDDGGTTIIRQATARPLEQVDLHLVGGPERFAKLLAAGRIRRRLGFWVLSRVRGNRDGLAALDALLALPLELPRSSTAACRRTRRSWRNCRSGSNAHRANKARRRTPAGAPWRPDWGLT